MAERWCRDLGRGLRFGGGLLKLGQLQLELGNDFRPALKGLAVLLAPGLGEEQLQALDLQPGAAHQGLGALGACFGIQPGGAFRKDHRVRGGEVRGQRVKVIHTKERSRTADVVITINNR
jgi:hypothetical protein